VTRHEIAERARALIAAGKPDDAAAILGEALQTDPAYPPYLAFLSLALFHGAHPRQALATMLHCALEAAPAAFDGFERVLGEHYAALLQT
jgi:predicted Zn-dependent protease